MGRLSFEFEVYSVFMEFFLLGLSGDRADIALEEVNCAFYLWRFQCSDVEIGVFP